MWNYTDIILEGKYIFVPPNQNSTFSLLPFFFRFTLSLMAICVGFWWEGQKGYFQFEIISVGFHITRNQHPAPVLYFYTESQGYYLYTMKYSLIIFAHIKILNYQINTFALLLNVYLFLVKEIYIAYFCLWGEIGWSNWEKNKMSSNLCTACVSWTCL